MKASAGRVLMFVECEYPFDSRVLHEASTLADAGYHVSVLAMRGKNEKPFEVLRGVNVYRMPRLTVFDKVSTEGRGFLRKRLALMRAVLGYFFEYSYFTLATLLFALYMLFKEGIDIVHLHNPPDTLFITGGFMKLVGKKVVFDHHDLSPELFLSRYNRTPAEGGVVYRALVLLEKINLRLADLVIATNESYRRNAITRGKVDPRKVAIVRNGPDLKCIQPVPPDAALKAVGKKILVYVGVMGPQDGVDYLLRALRHLLDAGRTDFYCVIIGKGDSLEDLKRLAAVLQLDEYVLFTGYIRKSDLFRYMSTADICVDPDPSSPLNDVSTWIKIMEYMAWGKPIVTFDLKETRYSARDAALYVTPNDERKFAQALTVLMDDENLRRTLGAKGRQRIERELQWDVVAPNLVNAYETLRSGSPVEVPGKTVTPAPKA